MDMQPQQKYFLTAEEVMEILCVKRTRAYDIIKELNRQLKEAGMMTVRGKVNAKYFYKKMLDVDTIA